LSHFPSFELLGAHHNRSAFDCGEAPLNQFLQKYANQNANRNIGITHVAVAPEDNTRVLGYYTLLTRTIERDAVPRSNRFPRDGIGVVLLGRLAVDKTAQGHGVGTTMLLRAIKQTSAAARNIGIHALVVDALNERARQWYLSFGFETLLDDPNHLYLPIETIRELKLDEE
jgi:GNAT superfamily N-acetyltransferase